MGREDGSQEIKVTWTNLLVKILMTGLLPSRIIELLGGESFSKKGLAMCSRLPTIASEKKN